MFDSQILTRKSSRANVRASEGAGTTTLTIRDNPWQIFNLSAARTVVLPSTGVVAGDQITLQNLGAFDLTIQSSNGSALTLANSANIDATIQIGHVILIALVNNPINPTDWNVLDLYEQLSSGPTTLVVGSGSGTLSSTSGYWNIKRFNNLATATLNGTFTVTGTVNAVRLNTLPPGRYNSSSTFRNFSGQQTGALPTGFIISQWVSGGSLQLSNQSVSTPSTLTAFTTGSAISIIFGCVQYDMNN